MNTPELSTHYRFLGTIATIVMGALQSMGIDVLGSAALPRRMLTPID